MEQDPQEYHAPSIMLELSVQGKRKNNQHAWDEWDNIETETLLHGDLPPEAPGRRVFVAVLLLIGFACGVLAGVYFGDRGAMETTNKSDSSKVSFDFLQTPRGAQLLKTLTTQLLEESPPIDVLRNLLELMETDDQLSSSCHPLIHKVGRVAFEELGFDGAVDDVVNVDPELLQVCNAAYMHGVIAAYIKEHSNSQEGESMQSAIAVVESKLCDKLIYRNGRWECLHGIGHAVLDHIRHQQLQLTLTLGVQACNEDQACENGLWHDHFQSTSITGELDGEALKICDLASPSVHSDCLLYAPTEFLLRYPGQYENAIIYCNSLVTTKDILSCVAGVGTQTAKDHMNDFQFVEQVCLSAPNEAYREACFHQGLVYYFMSTGSRVPPRLCQMLVQFKDKCLGKRLD
jgi:hypothetical protein